MIKTSIYPKTSRIGADCRVSITEKLDGSNLCLVKKGGVLYIAQRSTLYSFDEIDSEDSTITSKGMYKGLYGWIAEHKDDLLLNLRDDSAICCEWLGMGKLKYDFDKRIYMFAKAKVLDDFTLDRLNYDVENLFYVFENGVIPDYIGVVPLVYYGSELSYLTVTGLNTLYTEYCEKVGRNVEGFVVNYLGGIVKYVRMKNGTLADHVSNVKES